MLYTYVHEIFNFNSLLILFSVSLLLLINLFIVLIVGSHYITVKQSVKIQISCYQKLLH